MKKNWIIVCVTICITALSALAGDTPIVTIDIPRAKALAIQALKTKQPDVDTATLRENGVWARVSTNNEITVCVRYMGAMPEKTETVKTNGFEFTDTTQGTFVVELDALGRTKDITKESAVTMRTIKLKSP